MSDLDKHFKKILEEQVGFGFGTPGQLPVQEVGFPDTQSQVNPFQSTVTSGETTDPTQPREDYELENQIDMKFDPAIEEVGNLLVTIGHILCQSGLLGDKYDVVGVLDFLNHNFSQPDHPTEQNPEQMDMPACGDMPPTQPPEDGLPAPEPTDMKPGFAYLQEMKKLTETAKSVLKS